MHVFILVTEMQKTTMDNFQNNNKQLVVIVYFALFKIQLTLDSRVTLSNSRLHSKHLTADAEYGLERKSPNAQATV